MNAFVGFMIVLATITIVAVVTYRIMSTSKQQEVDRAVAAGTPACGLNATGGTGGTILYTNCSSAYDAIGELEDANDEVIDWLPIYIIAAVGFLIIGLFAFNQMR